MDAPHLIIKYAKIIQWLYKNKVDIIKEILGNNYYGFLAKYFTQDMSNPHRWYQTDYNKNCYYNRLAEQSIFIKKEDVTDLPEKTFLIRNTNLNKKQKSIYNNIITIKSP